MLHLSDDGLGDHCTCRLNYSLARVRKVGVRSFMESLLHMPCLSSSSFQGIFLFPSLLSYVCNLVVHKKILDEGVYSGIVPFYYFFPLFDLFCSLGF